ncbi:OmpA family protein [Polaribacter porphyrae]|uniref:Cell envelope biogenesis protein OmpA n=1 Tax=Polaribacter porphyrae TaxID=1137780 RepID=A0A2S7WT35_9FLAO|nr:OmpA family protein [Polaribacter porphyrae]PQJ80757.1 cell envelope biogenesis protein OmpA [Polaribacter porphyrae]
MKILKNTLLSTALLFMTFCINAQEYNKWSLDFGLGVHDVIYPLSPGLRTSSPGFGQVNLGIRHMFNDKFGLRLGLGYQEFSEADGTQAFKSNYYRTSIEAVVNAGNILKFGNWTERFNLLMYGGTGFSMLKVISPTAVDDPMLNFIFGFTPQYKLSNRISLFADVSTIFHHFQHNTYDGAISPGLKQTNVSLYNISLGVNVSLGNKRANADFWREELEDDALIDTELESLKNRLATAEKEIAALKDNTSSPNKELIMTELDNRYVKKEDLKSNKYASTVTASNVDFIKELLNRGYVNVYFDLNKTRIQKESLHAVNYIKQFMMDNPYVRASLIGFTDETGKEGYNKDLSIKRAKMVYDVLVSAGISPGRLSYGGVGEDKSMGKEARQLARKVAFRIE